MRDLFYCVWRRRSVRKLGCIRTERGWLCETRADVEAVRRMAGRVEPIYLRVAEGTE